MKYETLFASLPRCCIYQKQRNRHESKQTAIKDISRGTWKEKSINGKPSNSNISLQLGYDTETETDKGGSGLRVRKKKALETKWKWRVQR